MIYYTRPKRIHIFTIRFWIFTLKYSFYILNLPKVHIYFRRKEKRVCRDTHARKNTYRTTYEYMFLCCTTKICI